MQINLEALELEREALLVEFVPALQAALFLSSRAIAVRQGWKTTTRHSHSRLMSVSEIYAAVTERRKGAMRTEGHTVQFFLVVFFLVG